MLSPRADALPTPSAPVSATENKPRGEAELEELLAVERLSSPVAMSDDALVVVTDVTGNAQLALGKSGSKGSTIPLTSGARAAGEARRVPGSDDLLVVLGDGESIARVRSREVEPKPVTLVAIDGARLSAPAPSPDGARIAFTSTARNGRDFDLYFASSSSAFAKAAPSVELSGVVSALDWKGTSVLLREERTSSDHELFVIDSDTRARSKVSRAAGRYVAAKLSSDARAIYALSDSTADFLLPMRIDVATGEAKALSLELADADDLDVCRNAQGNDLLVVATNQGGLDRLSILEVDARGNVVRRTVAKDDRWLGVTTGISIAPGCRVAFVGLERPDLPGSVARLDLATGALSLALEGDHAGVDLSALVREEHVSVASFDRRAIDVLLFGRAKNVRRPLVVMLHGGPDLQARPTFSALTQALVAKGYLVAEPNVRGSSGYGKAFTHLDDRALRADAIKDVDAVVDALAGRADVDPAKLLILGRSYGGFLALSELVNRPTRFAAGVDLYGIADLRMHLERTAKYRRASREAEYGSLDTDTDLFRSLDLFSRLDSVRAPLLIVHGKRDKKVDFDVSLTLFQGLSKRRAPVEMLAFEDEGHGLSTREHRKLAYARILALFDSATGAK